LLPSRAAACLTGPESIPVLKQQHALDQEMRQMIGFDVREGDLAQAGAPQNVSDTQHYGSCDSVTAPPAQRRLGASKCRMFSRSAADRSMDMSRCILRISLWSGTFSKVVGSEPTI
jgi:hypothetical protein